MINSGEATPILETFDIVRLGKSIHKYINKVFVLTSLIDGNMVTQTGLFMGMVTHEDNYGEGKATIYLAYQEPLVIVSGEMQMVRFYEPS